MQYLVISLQHNLVSTLQWTHPFIILTTCSMKGRVDTGAYPGRHWVTSIVSSCIFFTALMTYWYSRLFSIMVTDSTLFPYWPRLCLCWFDWFPLDWAERCLETIRSTLTRVHRWFAVMTRVAGNGEGEKLAQDKQSNKHGGNPRVV